MASGAANIQRTLRELERRGWDAQSVECYIAAARRTRDLFGFGDVLAFERGNIYIIQVTSYSGLSARKRKILESEVARAWVGEAGGRILLHGWRRGKPPKGRKRGKWQLTEREITDGDFYESRARAKRKKSGKGAARR